jgi:hypothetical protein
VLRFEATVHDAKELRCRCSLDNFDQIITARAGMADRFAATLDCANIGFLLDGLLDGLLDELPEPARAGDSRISGASLNKPRIRAALSAALALARTRRYHVPRPAPAPSLPCSPSAATSSHRSSPGSAAPHGRQAQDLDRRRPRP